MNSDAVYKMGAEEAIMSRTSATKLDLPVPSPEDIDLICKAADRAPDHGRRRPWRVLIVENAQIGAFGNHLADSLLRRKKDASASDLDRERAKAARAPMIMVISAATDPNDKIPEVEQLMAVGAATQNMFLMAHALGYGAMWKTGDAAYDPLFKEALGIDRDHTIIGFLYLGTPLAVAPVREPRLDFIRKL